MCEAIHPLAVIFGSHYKNLPSNYSGKSGFMQIPIHLSSKNKDRAPRKTEFSFLMVIVLGTNLGCSTGWNRSLARGRWCFFDVVFKCITAPNFSLDTTYMNILCILSGLSKENYILQIKLVKKDSQRKKLVLFCMEIRSLQKNIVLHKSNHLRLNIQNIAVFSWADLLLLIWAKIQLIKFVRFFFFFPEDKMEFQNVSTMLNIHFLLINTMLSVKWQNQYCFRKIYQ